MAKLNLNLKRKKLKEEKRNSDLDFMKINHLLTHQMQFICGNLKQPILILGSVVSIIIISIIYLIHRTVKDLEHFACERDYSAFRSHTYRTVFEPFNCYQKAGIQTYRTLPTRKCPISMISKSRIISLTGKVSYIFDTPVHRT